MIPPPGVSHKFGEVCKLQKVLYGLKQAPRAWFHKFSKPMYDVFCYPYMLYVDDMSITTDDFDGITSLKTTLSHRFAMKDLGLRRYFLGIEVVYFPKGYLLSQSKYIANLFERVRLTNNKIVDTPLETSVRYSSFDIVPLTDYTLYQTIVGSLVYYDSLRHYTCYSCC